jgi:hypothetical protein
MKMKIYIDSEFRCHADNPDGTMREAETNFFDGKCKAFIEGYRFVPHGEIWTREDGTVFEGQMITPWKPYEELDRAQRDYERELAEAARILLGEVSA